VDRTWTGARGTPSAACALLTSPRGVVAGQRVLRTSVLLIICGLGGLDRERDKAFCQSCSIQSVWSRRPPTAERLSKDQLPILAARQEQASPEPDYGQTGTAQTRARRPTWLAESVLPSLLPGEVLHGKVLQCPAADEVIQAPAGRRLRITSACGVSASTRTSGGSPRA
jgi:hypothetical protein